MNTITKKSGRKLGHGRQAGKREGGNEEKGGEREGRLFEESMQVLRKMFDIGGKYPKSVDNEIHGSSVSGSHVGMPGYTRSSIGQLPSAGSALILWD